MEISRRNPTKRGNKENAEPAFASKTTKTRTGSRTVSVAPPHLKSIETQPNKRGESTQGDKQLMKTVNTVQKNARAMPAGKTNTRQTLSKAFLTDQAVKHKKILEAAKPPVPQPHTKPAPGLYKGKVVQSKIGAIWKSSVTKEGDQKLAVMPSTARVENRRVNALANMRSRSVTDLPRRADQKPKSTRSNSVSDGPRPAPKRPLTGRPPTALPSAPPAPRTTRPAPPSSARTGVVTNGAEARAVRDKRVNKPPVSSSLSQYRVPMESAEERRAKLADWLASKGKVLKRPVLSATLPAKVPIGHHVKPMTTVQVAPEPEPSQVPTTTTTAAAAVVPVPSASQPGETARVEDPASDASSPLTANATLDLLDNSDLDLPVDPEPRVNDIVVNLCEALSALATQEDEAQQKDQSDCEMADDTANEDEENKETPEEVADCKQEVKEDVETESEEEEEEEEDDDCKEYKIDEDEEEKDDTKKAGVSPTMGDASSVKYNVRTTPYLQSMRKGLQGEVQSARAAGSRRTPGIRDLKFLTPVRRSSRIHRNSARLPPMVLDHDPCVTSLAELVGLDGDDDANAYIYRKNPALLEDSQHHPKNELLSDSEYF